MRKAYNIFAGLLSVGLLIGSVVAVLYHQTIFDWVSLRGYDAPPRVSQLAEATTMTDATRTVFYVNHPELQDKMAFKATCASGEQSIVLGCYIESRGIYLLDVRDERLSGIVEVTAAHEVLHAHYDRLSSSERKRVDKMTADFFAGIKNERIKKTVESYRTKDPSIVPNELHSILGSEVRDLSPELESYYSQYFKNRKTVVTFSEKYEQTFVDLKQQVELYDARLQELKVSIDTNQKRLEATEQDINNEKAQLDELLARDKVDEYNDAVPVFNQNVNSYNALITTTRALIAEFNLIVDKRNGIATTEQELVQAIDANALPKRQ